MSLETMTKLASTTVGVTAQSSISFTNIPQGYTDLVIKVSGRTAATQGISLLSFNSVDTGLSSRIIYSIGSGGPGSATYSSSIRGGYIVGTDYTASVFANNEIYISNYSSNTFKSVSVDSVTENNATEAYSQMVAGLWANSSPITSLTFTVLSNSTGVPSTFTQHSTFTLYGIKNSRQTAGNSIKATGGNIIFDGTYVYHVFNSTGAFTPTQPILADALVVAGGGGGFANIGGAGGASLTYQSNSSFSVTSHVVTVGGGGPDSTAGTESSVNSISATGGATGFLNPIANGNANNGRGGAGKSVINGTTTDYTGGAGYYLDGSGGGTRLGGGGGSSAANGGAASNGTRTGGNGANGTAAYSSWGVATGSGQNVGGVHYFAGGGAGGGEVLTDIRGTPGLGGGGAAGLSNSAVINGQPGTANTGGGGGGGGGKAGVIGSSGGLGGSGIVIIRYKG
jgi:hypothetical protein